MRGRRFSMWIHLIICSALILSASSISLERENFRGQTVLSPDARKPSSVAQMRTGGKFFHIDKLRRQLRATLRVVQGISPHTAMMLIILSFAAGVLATYVAVRFQLIPKRIDLDAKSRKSMKMKRPPTPNDSAVMSNSANRIHIPQMKRA